MPADLAPERRPGPAQRVLLTLIRSYQMLFAPMYSGSCRFIPSCSSYAAEAIERFGAIRGSRLAAGRLMRCHPFGGHGLDPVPDPPGVRHDPPAVTPPADCCLPSNS